MIRRHVSALTLVGLVAAAPATAQEGPAVGREAPGFTLPDTRGGTHTLEQYRGGWVVLEWLNYDCPYVGKHYRSGNIPRQQERWTGEGVAWLAVVSSAPGTQGYFAPDEMNARSEREGSRATAVLLDPSGSVGRAYGARTTPHMYIIDPAGTLRYMGGIDDVPTARVEDLERATQLVDRGLEELFAGGEPSVTTSRPYGCSVKYADGG